MKSLIFSILFISLGASSFAQSLQNDSRFISHDLDYIGKDIILQVGCDVEVKTWKGDKIRIYVEIDFRNHNRQLIKELAKMNRYQMTTIQDAVHTSVSIPNLNQIVIINGVALQEEVNFKVLIPENMDSYIHSNGDLAITSRQINSNTLNL